MNRRWPTDLTGIPTCPVCSCHGTYAALAECGHIHMLPCRACALGLELADRVCCVGCDGRGWTGGTFVEGQGLVGHVRCVVCKGRGTLDVFDALEAIGERCHALAAEIEAMK